MKHQLVDGQRIIHDRRWFSQVLQQVNPYRPSVNVLDQEMLNLPEHPRPYLPSVDAFNMQSGTLQPAELEQTLLCSDGKPVNELSTATRSIIRVHFRRKAAVKTLWSGWSDVQVCPADADRLSSRRPVMPTRVDQTSSK